MARVLQELLALQGPLVPQAFGDLERSAGGDGVDIRLIADITHMAHDIMRQLRLDTADTTARELYKSLNAYCVREAYPELLLQADYTLIALEGEVISFNIIDVIENAHHDLDFEHRIVSHGQRSLRGEVVQRYHNHPRTSEEATVRIAVDAGLVQEEDHHHGAESQGVFNQSNEGDNKMKPRILAIGDIFTDAFIKLNDDEARVTKDENGVEWLSVQFGAKMPYDHVDVVESVGPSPNASVSFSRLGVNAELMAFLGDDEIGKSSLEYLRSQGVGTSSIHPEAGAKSSYWYVLRYGADRTMLVKNEDFAYEWHEPDMKPEWIYLSQISPNSWNLHEKLLDYLQRNPDIKLAFQPGTSHFRWGVEKLQAVYGRSHIIVMNREEAMDVTGRPYDSVQDLANGLHDLGPAIVVITDGPKGSYASYEGKLVTIPNYPDPAPPYERTGAGDAFASTIVASLALGEPMDTALTWAPINSAYVVQKLGAQVGLLTREELQAHLQAAPEWYKVSEFNG